MNQNRKGFTPIHVILVFVVVGIIAGTGWFAARARNDNIQPAQNNATTQTNPQQTPSSNQKMAEEDPTADWVQYTDKTGKFTLKHPKSWALPTRADLCTDGLILLGGNVDSVGACASDSGGQMSVFVAEGDQKSAYVLSPDYFKDIKTSSVTINGTPGERQEGSAYGDNVDALGGYAEGTKVIHYIFVTEKDRTYVAMYVQKSSYPNVLSDFDTMITKTLKFTI
jgi:hypothetical protein